MTKIRCLNSCKIWCILVPTRSRLHTYLFYTNLANPDYLGLRLIYIVDLLFVAHLRNFIFARTSCFPDISV